MKPAFTAAYFRERILPRTAEDAAGCLVWQGRKLPKGYGKISHGSKKHRRDWYVHRVAWECLKSPIPVGLVIDHLCRNTSCANVDHMEVVTQRVNNNRGIGRTAVNARKTECIHGHAFDEANTRIVKTPYGPGRACKACERRRDRVR